jgi:hypothetical protein
VPPAITPGDWKYNFNVTAINTRCNGLPAGVSQLAQTAVIEIRTSAAWWQTIGGSAYAINQIQSYVPGGVPTPTPPSVCNGSAGSSYCLPYLNLPNPVTTPPPATAQVDTAGYAISGIAAGIDTQSDATSNYQNLKRTAAGVSDLRRIEGASITAVAEKYDDFAQRLGVTSSTSRDKSAAGNVGNFLSTASVNSGFYYFSTGTVTDTFILDTALNVASGNKYVVFVNGNLTVNNPSPSGPITTVANGGFLMFIVKGNITVNGALGTAAPVNLTTSPAANVAGVFIADGTIDFASVSPANNLVLITDGSWVGWSGVSISRSFANKLYDNVNPTVVFRSRPDFIYNAPESIKKPLQFWQEVN